MPKHGHMRHGSLQFYPRVRAKKRIPRVSWDNVSKENGLLGFIGYKVGMGSCYVRDNSSSSMTKGQRITVPVTIIEFPTMKILSVRFYKNKRVVGEVMNSGIDKEVKKRIKVPKGKIAESEKVDLDKFDKEYDDLRVIVYSQAKKTGIKKMPNIAELGIQGSLDDKMNFIKENLSKEISITSFLKENDLIDVRGVTKGKGLQGPTKRFGLSLRFHKSEKGVRGPGSGGPWHPARVEYTQPMAGQMGYFTRVVYNNKVIKVGSISDEDINSENGFKKFGKIKNDYAIVFGSVQGPSKRELLITPSFRTSKKQNSRNMEFIELR
jgi:large subunit ribosomal protein L3|tara:strand:- start:58 stop:1023 length:966 start_codon:yes stop_codon:yes gene_type:complete